MELKDLEKRLIDAEVKAELAMKLADKALDMAMDAMLKIKAKEESTHQVVVANQSEEISNILNEVKTAREESEPVPRKLSPFGTFMMPTYKVPRQVVEDASKVLESAVEGEEREDPFWNEEAEGI